ncbi:MAG: FAD-binding and (Fe-S)-binding domain-containing protein [Phycisphaerae bacterium]
MSQALNVIPPAKDAPINPSFDPAVVAALEADLKRSIAGDVRFDRLSRTIYSTDASIYEIIPVGVVMPRTTEDVVAIVKLCGKHGVPIIGRGAGTGIAGGAIGWGVIVDYSRFMTRIRDINPAARTVRVQPGVVLDDLNAALAPHALNFPPDVATASRATIGGMIGNNSCGSHSVYYGRTVDYVVDLTVVLADGSVVTLPHQPYADLPARKGSGFGGQGTGQPDSAESLAHALGSDGGVPLPPREIHTTLERIRRELHEEVLARYPRVMRRNGGYALDRLCMSEKINPATIIIGSEGTLAIVVEATLRLVPNPRCKALLVLHFNSHLDAVGATPDVLRHNPSAVELVDDLILNAGAPQIPAATRERFLSGSPRAILVCELYDDDADTLNRRMHALADDMRDRGIGQPGMLVFDLATQAAVWTMRNKGFGLLMSRPGERHPYEFIEDAAVDPAHLRDYITELDAMLAEEGVTEVGHYAHASVGVIHVRPVLNLHQPDDVRRLRSIAKRTTDLVLKYGGAMTGEHGDGIIRSEWLERMYGPRIVAAFGEIKRAFDPHNLLNPRKIVDPLPMDQRLKVHHGPLALPERSHFDYGGHENMAGLANMCSGVGQCRQKLVGTMCPSYMATLDERHTTRARAVALRAALNNQGLLRGLDDPALDEVMDLCLSCKACKTECPTGVDMAKLKSEWLATKVRRGAATSVDRFLSQAAKFARLGSMLPGVSNWVAQSRLVRGLLQRWYDVDARVAPPRFAKQTFHSWASRHRSEREAQASASRQRSEREAQASDRERAGPETSSRGRQLHNAGRENGATRDRVIYFVDTWMNHYWPEVGIAAVRLLEAAGFDVVIPKLGCCGRPLISKGYLDEAAALARANVAALSTLVDDNTWIVGNEPSCVLQLLDESPALVRGDESKRLASRVRMVDQLLTATLREDPRAISFTAGPPQRVLLHGHCHQKALVGTADTLTLLSAIPGFSVTEINSGCCGMAGSFGHEHKHYDVAKAVGEQRLFPAVRTRGDAIVAVCGFSCREQLVHHCAVEPPHALELAASRLA